VVVPIPTFCEKELKEIARNAITNKKVLIKRGLIVKQEKISKCEKIFIQVIKCLDRITEKW
jgi:flagellin-specific chaperone FliS